jgi:Lon protease-like protein
MENKEMIRPFFPLSVFLFPGEDIPLRIFEPRYRQLIEEVRDTGDTFVIPFVIGQEIQEYGCEVKLKEVVGENPGGRMVITVESMAVVQIISYDKQLGGKLYAGGIIKRMSCSDPVESEGLKELMKNYIDQFDDSFLNCCNLSSITRQDVMKALNLSSEEKYNFICMPDDGQKENYLAGQIQYLSLIRKQETLLGNDFGLN